jgi:SAM-dependent methyltransferase
LALMVPDPPSEPRTWHYGLVATWWAEFHHGGPEIEFLRPLIAAGQPALDVACGTGRVLLPLLRDGFDIDGSDLSPDMLARCRELAEREGVAPNLYEQATHELRLPRTYRTIYACGSFGLGGSRDHDREALERLYEHLEPGGLLVLDHEMPYASAEGWSNWTADGRRALPETFEEPEWRTGSDGVEYRLRSRTVEVDPLAQRLTLEVEAAMRRGDEVRDETYLLAMTMYTANHIELMLRVAGFEDIESRADWTDQDPTPETTTVVFLARKPANG